MNALPEGLDTQALIDALADGWGFVVAKIEYARVGFGSYHWDATDAHGRRAFVTVDDLGQKPWLGDDPDAAFDGLTRAFGSAIALRDAGLGFVVAPIATTTGEPVRRIGAHHSVALFPFVDGRPGERFMDATADERAPVAAMLARLHGATGAVESIARRIDLALPGRIALETALHELHEPWPGGPFSEPARQALAGHADDVTELLGLVDRLGEKVAASGSTWVVTHGEPHPLNVLRTDAGRMLVDWDTVALAPRERDLWMLVDDHGSAPASYVEATGQLPDPVAIDLFRLMWDLADLAAFTGVLRAPHRQDEDTAKAFAGLSSCVAIRDRWAARLA